MRLDIYLTEKGFFQSRSKAKSAIENKTVKINGVVADKPSLDIEGEPQVEVTQKERFVSRAGEKLFHALEEFNISVNGLTVLDIGASTGGFTDCVLQQGAKRVFALDVGVAQLDNGLRNDNRVTVMENVNARYIGKSDFHTEIDMIVMDVSFISQTLIYSACADILSAGKYMITLIKPQFEAGKKHIGKGGIVKDKDGKILKEILEKIDLSSEACGFKRIGFTNSPIEGGDGNREYLALFQRKE
ncbi:MAG: TlyA family RNA methyltransferase [Ruminococcaceae bacterium]|nr:TlyA family RNA methyltransferase [Oscillospiraceae bacterium]